MQQLVSGGIQYAAQDTELLQLIEFLDDKVEDLRPRSELDRLKATTPEERHTAVQKLKSFIYATSKYVGKKAVTRLLVAYLESLISGGHHVVRHLRPPEPRQAWQAAWLGSQARLLD